MLFNQRITDLLHILKNHGIVHAVICPGSRNAPLIQGFYRDPHFRCHSIVDERSAGYVALGMARELDEPVAVATTSGTAALNLAPAVAEAYYQHIPLIALTADRPKEWPPQLDNQIIDQQEIFLRNSNAFYNIPFDSNSELALWKINGDISRIIHRAIGDEPGPVHINVQLREPLYDDLPQDFSGKLNVRDASFSNLPSFDGIFPKDKERISKYLSSGKKVLILAGMRNYSAEERELLVSLSMQFQLTVIAENITNLSSDLFIDCPEIVLGALDEEGSHLLRPDMIVGLGGQVVSKKIRNFINGNPKIPVVATENFPEKFFSSLIKDKSTAEKNKFLEAWQEEASLGKTRAGKYLSSASFSNLTVLGKILGAIPEGSVVHFGNSGTVRYSQLHPTQSELTFYANRGTSGIDGSLSTAAGAAMVSDVLHVAVLGDLSFVYDSNGMWNRDFPRNLRFIVLNDSGGGIFRIIDGPDRMPFFEEYSVAHHPVSIHRLVEAFGLSHRIAHDYQTLDQGLEFIFKKDSGPCVLEVETGNSKNSTIFKQFFQSLKN